MDEWRKKADRNQEDNFEILLEVITRLQDQVRLSGKGMIENGKEM